MHISVCICVYPYIYKEQALRSLTLKSWKVYHSRRGNNQTQVCVYSHNSNSFGRHSLFFCPFVPLQSASQSITLQPGPSRCVIYSLPPWEVLRHSLAPEAPRNCQGSADPGNWQPLLDFAKRAGSTKGSHACPESSVPVHSQNKTALHGH